MSHDYKAVVIGGGPGGYVCAIRLGQLGMKTALIEKESNLGGTCLNVGCIPSKALLDSSERLYQMKHHAREHGISPGKIEFDLDVMMKRKEKVISDTVTGIQYLMKKNKIDVFQGTGKLTEEHQVEVSSKDKTFTLNAEYIILATGSRVAELNQLKFDGKKVISSTHALSLKEIPKSLIVVGGGFIGLELGSVYAKLGSDVSIVEYMDTVAPSLDSDISRALITSFKKMGIKFHLGHGVTGGKWVKNHLEVTIESRESKEVNILKSDMALVATGRVPYTEGLGLSNLGIELDSRGRVIVDEFCRTKFPHIFAIGDIIDGPMLAHKAEEEGVFVAEVIDGQKPHLNRFLIPSILYTHPEASGIGKTEGQLKSEKTPYKVGKFPFKASGRARAMGETDGFVKVLAHRDSDEVLGVHIIGPVASELISQSVVAMEFRASAEDLSRIIYGHPTFSESVKEAALAATANRSLHQ